jgi:hypothetical protein
MQINQILQLPLLLLTINVCAQNNNPILVKAGTSIKESVPVTEVFEYPHFKKGTVVFRDGKKSQGAMNYNRFFGEMQFVAANGDTLAMINEKEIDYISIEDDTFVYDKVYIKLLSDSANVKFGTRRMLRIVDRKKMGAYGTTSSIESIDSYNSISDGLNTYSLVVMQDVYLGKRVQYFVGNEYNHFVPATKKGILSLFAKQQPAIRDYLNEHPVDFNDLKSIDKLVQFIRSR